jgi:hypothetical protein
MAREPYPRPFEEPQAVRSTHRIAPALLALFGFASTPPEAKAQTPIVGFGFAGPMGGGMMFSGPGVGLGGQLGGGGQPGFFPNAMVGAGMFPPQAHAMNNLDGVAAVIDQQMIRRPGQPLPAVRRRRR